MCKSQTALPGLALRYPTKLLGQNLKNPVNGDPQCHTDRAKGAAQMQRSGEGREGAQTLHLAIHRISWLQYAAIGPVTGANCVAVGWCSIATGWDSGYQGLSRRQKFE